MAKMISQAGEMAVTLTDVSREGDDLVLTGQMGVWNSKIVVGREETLKIARLMLKPSVLAFLASAPFGRSSHPAESDTNSR